MNRLPALTVLFALLLVRPAAAETVPELYRESFSLETQGDYSEALDRMDRLLRGGEDDYLVHLRRGWLLYLDGRYADSVRAYEEATEREPRSAEALAGLSLPLMALRRWPEAEVACRRLLRIAPGNYLGLSRLAFTLYSAGRFADAEAVYGEVLAQYPSDSDMRAGLGWAQLRQGKTTEALSAFRRVLRVLPEHTSAGQGLASLE